MDFEGKIFEFQELEAQNKGKKVNKTICFKGSGGLYQRQKGYDGDCNFNFVDFNFVIAVTMLHVTTLF